MIAAFTAILADCPSGRRGQSAKIAVGREEIVGHLRARQSLSSAISVPPERVSYKENWE